MSSRKADVSSKNADSEESAGALSLDDFRDPPMALRGKPFWSWNGQLEKDELLRQVEVAKEMGMGGAFMHSRTGLKNEYLGDEWFELINACAQKCKEEHLEGWLYDEDRWPSGTAGGKITQNPEFRMRSIRMYSFSDGERIEWPEAEDFLEAHLAELDGLHLSSYEALELNSVEICPEGKQVLVFVREVHPSNSFYNNGAYLDTLNPDATKAFIESTHEKYLEHCGEHFGEAIKGIFTDEPHRGFILCDGVEQPGAANSSYSMPYAEDLFDRFEEAFGESLRGRLSELCFQYHGQRLSRLKWQYVELLQRLFIQNWAKPCADWCEENGLMLTGHVLHEDSLAAQVVPAGSLFRYYETMTYPGIDVLTNRCEAFWVAKQVVSTARQLGKPFVLSELYGGSGWDLRFDGHKRIGDWQAFQGVNLRCHHLSWYSMAGESKRDYPASIFHQSAWYPEYKYVEDYFSRINYVLLQGEPDCDILVVHPGESLWAQFHLGWAKWLGSASAVVDEIEERFTTLYHWLMDAQLDFDYGDEEQMSRLGSIEVVDDEAFLRIGKMTYRSVVLGGMDTMRGSTLELLQRFVAAGGSVVFAGSCPTYLDAEPSDAPLRFAGEIGSVAWNQDALISAIRSKSEQVLSLNNGRPVPGIICHVRRLENGDLFVALVNTKEEAVLNVSLSLSSVGKVDEWFCRTGEVEAVPVDSSGDGLSWSMNFEALEERVFRVRINSLSENPWKLDPPSEPRFVSEAQLNGPFEYELSEPNTLILDRPRYRVDGGPWQASEDILKIDDALREQLGWSLRTGTMVQPWAAGDFVEQGPQLELKYTFVAETIGHVIDLLVEQPERWDICINGQKVTIPKDPQCFIDIALKRISLPTNSLIAGENVLSMKSRLQSDTDLEAIYLLGEFGVYQRAGELVLTDLPKALTVGDLTKQGLPFYSGKLSCLFPLRDLPECDKVVCELPEFGAACGKIIYQDSEAVIAFPPFRANFDATQGNTILRIDLTLTRRNLFGPLHQIPKESVMTAPVSYRTVGANYSREPQLYPSGLLAAPIIRFTAH
jgi:hypothetical protein